MSDVVQNQTTAAHTNKFLKIYFLSRRITSGSHEEPRYTYVVAIKTQRIGQNLPHVQRAPRWSFHTQNKRSEKNIAEPMPLACAAERVRTLSASELPNSKSSTTKKLQPQVPLFPLDDRAGIQPAAFGQVAASNPRL